jgi:hypothetical protein
MPQEKILTLSSLTPSSLNMTELPKSLEDGRIARETRPQPRSQMVIIDCKQNSVPRTQTDAGSPAIPPGV